MKERLVGAAVLVAIGVWLIPWVLDGPEAPLDTGASSLQLPAAEEPMPLRTQTLRLGEPEETPSSAASPETSVSAAAPSELPAAEPIADSPAEATTAIARRPEPAPPSTTETAPTASAPTAETAPSPSPPRSAESAPANPPRAAVAAVPTPKPAQPAAAGDWIVQLGSFGEEANARRLAQRASTFGYKADVSSYRSSNRTLYRVRVGPATNRAKADATASALKAHGIESRVVAAR